ncbi:RNA-binding protein Nova-1, putative [Plasmodium ovale wallikeri]|uniref:RNA-binding protein Nova-1, putative n=3 Tax=Plasmodium ovale TaxID=36330 RepID=A0A1A8X0J3_PLAOA|nr:RNA-binding protein Nova-1, putative [Plasmodium ovale curtisi]SBT45799.1 RNA-binding protein Nova-1, putative [Plasmodium ovale wallikeri]SBT78913.1 RNA-binding protein Nova-1, putative [Plasmodium ovale]SBS97677.1 RNA-binding protein Nova-1, putative [Plasmodium ovale curtisi]SBT46387.1 RNA-binding protein Nova-1, putative [Plasmodium ovale wallikeri]
MEESTQVEKKLKTVSQLCFVKMLVNNLVAGSVIGKNGSIITSIENKTGCSLKLSPSNSYFPNTQERVLVLCGKQEQINNALLIILDKIRQISSQNVQDKQNINNIPKYTCRIVVPKSAVSAIIGKGGQQIKQLQDSTGSKIQISSREDGLNERIISIIGPFESVSDTALKVTNSIQNDPNLKDLLNVIYSKESNFNNRSLSHNFINQVPLNGYVVPQQYGVFQQEQYMDVNMMNSLMRHSRDLFNLHCEISIQIPDEVIGSVIGKNGSRLTNIMNSTGAQIRISRKGELVPGTVDRKVQIMGTVAAVHAAHVLLLQRLESVYMQLRSMQVKCDT